MARKKTPDVMGDLLGEKSQAKGGQTQNVPSSKKAAPRPSTESRAAAGPEKKEAEALRTIEKHAIWASGIGLLPMPLVDIVALSGLQLRMVSVLARLYRVDFSQSAGRTIIASLLSSVGANSLRRGAFGSLVKSIPLVGWVAGWFVMPVAAGALTYAVGKVFAQHFASGGTLIDCDLEQLKQSFKEQYRRGLELFRR